MQHRGVEDGVHRLGKRLAAPDDDVGTEPAHQLLVLRLGVGEDAPGALMRQRDDVGGE
jgi:hypothetical protein